MTNDVSDQQARDWMERDFLGPRDRNNFPPADERMTSAVEYMAYHIGQIDKKLDRLTAALELMAAKT
jgi:hypothetical protein